LETTRSTWMVVVPISSSAKFEAEGHAVTVSIAEIFKAGLRFEASAFGIERREAIEALQASEWKLQALCPDLCPLVDKPVRFTRVYVGKTHGVPFMTSSGIINLRPQAEKYLSYKVAKQVEKLTIQVGDVLISRSGTIGNVALAGQAHAGMVVSEDVIRVRIPDKINAGFATAFLRCRYGRPQLTGASYGSVITHIEPHHLESVLLPKLPENDRVFIGQSMVSAMEARDEANRLLDEADRLLHEQLKLPPLLTSEETTTRTVKASQLAGRFEATFHAPHVAEAERRLALTGLPLLRLGDKHLTQAINAVTKFRKHVYVRQGGIPMLNSKQLFQIDPINVKAIARGRHIKDLPEIALVSEMIMITCSGTVGKAQIIPSYMNGWTASQDAHRIIGVDAETAGYIYAWLASDYGSTLLKRQTYGSVILHIDLDQLANLAVPLASSTVRAEIGNLVLQANALRTVAWEAERNAIIRLEKLISDGQNKIAPAAMTITR
jgi:type I restriction enzyme S subunit